MYTVSFLTLYFCIFYELNLCVCNELFNQITDGFSVFANTYKAYFIAWLVADSGHL